MKLKLSRNSAKSHEVLNFGSGRTHDLSAMLSAVFSIQQVSAMHMPHARVPHTCCRASCHPVNCELSEDEARAAEIKLVNFQAQHPTA
eukprot:6016039-Prymnesium_polylepis.1